MDGIPLGPEMPFGHCPAGASCFPNPPPNMPGTPGKKTGGPNNRAALGGLTTVAFPSGSGAFHVTGILRFD